MFSQAPVLQHIAVPHKDVMSWVNILTYQPSSETATCQTATQPCKKQKREAKPSQTLWMPNPLTWPTRSETVLPTHIEDLHVCIINHLSRALPVECEVVMLGERVSFSLVAVFYRNNKLVWLVLNRANSKLHLSSHWMADATHLFHSVRSRMAIAPDDNTSKTFARESFNHACFLGKRRLTKLLPSFVLQLRCDAATLRKVRQFLSTDVQFVLPGTVLATPALIPTVSLSPLLSPHLLRPRGKCSPEVCACGFYVNRLIENTSRVLTHQEVVAYVVHWCPSVLYNAPHGTALLAELLPLLPASPAPVLPPADPFAGYNAVGS